MDSLAQRTVLPELLDHLPPEDPAAIRSRSELRLINRLMDNHGWFVRKLKSWNHRPSSVLELGAGDGTLLAAALAGGAARADSWQAMDLAPAPPGWPTKAAWHQGDLFRLESLPAAQVVVANLFLHHFETRQLAWIGARLPASCRLLLASEPARHPVHRIQGRVLAWLADLGPVTRHDMDVSIRAGFRGTELPDWMGLQGWQVRTSRTPMGAYRFQAWR